MKKVIISIACCALVAPLAFAKDIKGKELKRTRPWHVAFLAETPATVTVTAPNPNQRVEGALAASYQPPRTIVVHQDGPGTYILEARGHVFNSRGEMVEGPISPGARAAESSHRTMMQAATISQPAVFLKKSEKI